MHRLALINMPFASLQRPSIALTQLKAIVDRDFAGRVSTEIHYFNQEFANYLGFDSYEMVGESMEGSAAGVGDWFFRQLAFPDLPDNSYEYFRRYFSARGTDFEMVRDGLLEKRRGLQRHFRRLIDRHRLDQATIVGFTSMFSQTVACLAMARLLKERNPSVRIVMGGANCEAPMGREIARRFEAIDFVFSGPALDSFPRVVGHLLAGEADACHAVHGVFTKQNVDGSRPAVAPLGREVPIDVEIPLDYDDFFAALDGNFPGRRMEPHVLFETSRGCWWGERSHCTFCGLNGGTMRYRSMEPDRAVAKLESLFSRYAGRCSLFEAVDNILPRSYLTDVLPRLSPPPDAKIFYEVKADLKDDEMGVLAAAGVTAIQPGIESLASSTLKLMRKGTTSFINIRFLKQCLRHRIHPIWNLLIGFPREEEAVYRQYLEDIPTLRHLPPPSGVFPVRFDRFSPYFVEAEEYGLDLRPADYFRYIYPFEEEELRDLVYYFRDAELGAPYAVAAARWLEPLREGVAAWRASWQQAEERPHLCFLEPGVVYDTRSGTPTTHRLGELALEVLELLEVPRKLKHLEKRVEGVPGDELEREVARLEELGLVFREGDQALSLIAPPATSLSAAA